MMNKANNMKQFFLTKTIYKWATYILMAYYLTYIFRDTGDIYQVVYNVIVVYTAIAIGMVFAGMIVGKLGVEKVLRLSFILFIVTGLSGIFLSNTPMFGYMAISTLRGFSVGIFWLVMHFLEMAGMKSKDRGKFYSMIFGVSTIFNVIAPVILGFLLAMFKSYIPIYAAFTFVSLVGALYPFDFKLKADRVLTKEEFIKVFRETKFNKFTSLSILMSIYWISSWFISAFVPFLILGSELNMGLYLAFASILASLIAIATRDIKIKRKVRLGRNLLVVTSLASIPLVISFSVWSLFFSGIIGSVTSAIIGPVEENLDIRISDKLRTSNKSYTELIVVREMLYFVVRVGVSLIALLMLQHISLVVFLKVFVAISVFARWLHFILSERFLKN